jgi:DNA-binding transcriptional ArsR family regulator
MDPQHIDQLRQALLDANPEQIEAPQAWLMGEIATVLQSQDREKMMELRGYLADLIPLADHYGTSKPGDRWRTAWELLQASSASHQPLEQYRLAEPGRLSGLILKHIKQIPGITPGELTKILHKMPNQISNELKRLRDDGLVHQIPNGNKRQYFLSSTARGLLEQQSPARSVPAPAPARKFPHVRKDRLEQRPDIHKIPAIAIAG